MSSIDSLAMAAMAMQTASTKQNLSIAMVKQQLEAQESVVQLVTVATEAVKGQVVNLAV